MMELSGICREYVVGEEVVRPDLDLLQLGEVRREQRTDRTTADDADSHE